ncbi:2-hydroxymuconate tautomerase family protein [Solimicrobium silvestre]|uniref:Tautomerase n=1 Tax=Solimicrobium silvestre TaxID=2099400 RepID=A0A2S9H402_9BURK|nr:4-oxalocrotonate tautomerase family protein [Solimicrobium silvestre]PRC94709.1 taut: 4-oxalocrotonate tautomerase family enzyme [Solimicrobium silvestre]
MPYINIRVTREGVTPEQKLQLIEGATNLLSRILNKHPSTTFVIIDEVDTDNWGLAGENITSLRRREAKER